MDPKVKELIKEFERELACMWWYSIRVYGPVLKIEDEDGGGSITLVKCNDKIFLEYNDGVRYKIGVYTPDEIRKILEWDERLEELYDDIADKPLSEQQKDTIRKKLCAGEDIHRVSQAVGFVYTLAVYEFAKKENLPINLPIEYICETERR